MNFIALFVILLVLVGFVLLVMYLPEGNVAPYDDDARQLITQFTKSGEMIGFDVDLSPPVTKYVYTEVTKTVSTKLENGTIVNSTETVLVPVEKDVSSIDLQVQDKQYNHAKICKLGYQCYITGTIVLIDPLTGNKVPPPYSYLITLDCKFRDFCTLSPPLSVNEVSFSDGSFSYMWIPTQQVGVGTYKASIYVTSQFTNVDGEQQRRLAERIIEVVN